MEVAKQFLLAKIKGENELLRKYGLHLLDYYRFSQAIKELEGKDLRIVRNRLMSYEGKCSAQYFNQVFQLFSECIRPEKRKTFKAYDCLNNVLNLAYNVLFWKVQIALSKARLEPYLGFLHVVQFGTPSLVCDFMEIYRFLVDDFVVQYARSEKLSERDFVLETEDYGGRKGKRQYLKYEKATELSERLNRFFESKVSIPRIKRGARQEIETLINEEAMLFAMYLRSERKEWIPRIVSLN
jgi:CRISPR-associated endonuclease Cas1